MVPPQGDILVITLWWSHLDLFLIASGNAYQWSAEPYMEIFNKHTPAQH